MTNNLTSNFTPPRQLNTAVLFLVFNRLDPTKQVFEAIKEAKPPRLYIAADGARAAKDGEVQKVKEVRDYITSNIDWECEVKTLFREQNLGCKMAVSGAIDWFFDNEEMGIILEDDCLPSQSFFWFCEELLKIYKDDIRIWHISGTNLQNGIQRGNGDYYMSKYNNIWGWASWRNRWKFYDVELERFTGTEFLNQVIAKKDALRYWSKIYKLMKTNKINTWDYQWTFSCWKHNGLSILPNLNLIKNIGYGTDATHTTNEDSSMSNIENFDLTFPLISPKTMALNNEADEYLEKKFYYVPNLFKRVINKITRSVFGKNIW